MWGPSPLAQAAYFSGSMLRFMVLGFPVNGLILVISIYASIPSRVFFPMLSFICSTIACRALAIPAAAKSVGGPSSVLLAALPEARNVLSAGFQ